MTDHERISSASIAEGMLVVETTDGRTLTVPAHAPLVRHLDRDGVTVVDDGRAIKVGTRRIELAAVLYAADPEFAARLEEEALRRSLVDVTDGWGRRSR